MAGVKGRSGGARPGAGRKGSPRRTIGVVAPVPAERPADAKPVAPTTPPVQVAEAEELTIGDLGDVDPLAFLEAVMRNPLAADQLRVRAAVTVAAYRHSKKGDAGKKGAKEEAARKASGAGGRFAPATPPKATR
jgi:phage terminase small subunit